MERLLVICGPTGIGKTSLALHLAKKFDAELVSADSRQVYKGMNIGTGKDLPVNSKFQISNSKLEEKGISYGYYLVNGVRIWGYDLVDAKKEFSVAKYLRFARRIVKDIWKRNKLLILVGGTGLYIKAVVDGIPTAPVPRNKRLRESLKEKSKGELFETLAQLDPIKAASMNSSDRKNPRRLSRAIEIAMWKLKGGLLSSKNFPRKQTAAVGPRTPILFVGLTAPRSFLDRKIERRVSIRIGKGVEEEIKFLLKTGVKWEHQSMTSLGYKRWKGYFQGKKTHEEVIREWTKDEQRYARRQMIWFRRDKRVNWFNTTKEDHMKGVEKVVQKWHNIVSA